MGRHRPGHSVSHRVIRLGVDFYCISWTVDRYYKNSRLRFPTHYSRDTDTIGAMRFVKRWGITRNIPEELQKEIEMRKLENL